MTLQGTCTSIYNMSKTNGKVVPKATAQVGSKFVNSVFPTKSSSSTSTSSSLETFALIASTITAFAPTILSLINKNGQIKDPDNKSTKSGASNTPNTTAKDPSTDLAKAISDCQNNGQIEALRAKTAEDKTSQTAEAATIEQMTTQPQKAYDKANTELTTLNDTYGKEKDALTELKDNEQAAEKDATAADQAVTKAQSSYDDAALNVLTAEENVTKATDSATKTAAQAALTQAKTKQTEAKTALDKAKATQVEKNKAKATAQKARADKEAAVEKLAADVKTKKTEVDTTKTALTKAAAEQKTAKARNDKWATTIQEAETELAKYGTADATKNSPEEKPEEKAAAESAPKFVVSNDETKRSHINNPFGLYA